MFSMTAAKYPDVNITAGLDAAPADAQGMYAPPAYPVYITAGKDVAGALDMIGGAAFDVVVDFSHPSALSLLLALSLKRSAALIIATTGHTAAQMDEITEASKSIPVFKTANMSVGINLMLELIETAASVLSDGFDIELVEAHHNQKLDAPSGTALMLADAMNAALSGGKEYIYDRHNVRARRDKKEIGIHAIRGGTIVGEHSVIFAGNDELIEIKHSAASREIFAEGAVRAVRFIAEEGRSPGLYSMRDVIRK